MKWKIRRVFLQATKGKHNLEVCFELNFNSFSNVHWFKNMTCVEWFFNHMCTQWMICMKCDFRASECDFKGVKVYTGIEVKRNQEFQCCGSNCCREKTILNCCLRQLIDLIVKLNKISGKMGLPSTWNKMESGVLLQDKKTSILSSAVVVGATISMNPTSVVDEQRTTIFLY